MRRPTVTHILRNALIGGALCLAGGSARAQDAPGIPGPVRSWDSPPYRTFGPAKAILGGQVLLRDESADPALEVAISAELRRLAVELQEKEGWRAPAPESDPLQLFIGRRFADGTRRVSSRGLDRGSLVAASIQLDATGMTPRQIAREVGRLYATATLEAYGVSDHSFLTAAAAQYLEGSADDEDRETAALSASAAAFDLNRQPAAVGRLYVEEFCRQAGGAAALRVVWEKAAEMGEEPLAVLQRGFTEATGLKENALLLSFAARLYSGLETESAPSHVTEADLESGALDTSAPPAMSVRHRAFVPGTEAASALRISFPEDASPGVAVVRYRDAQLPPDVLYLTPGAVKPVSLAGVARVDFAVIGSADRTATTVAPAAVEPLSGFPFAGLSAQAVAGPGGPRLIWTTATHDGLAGWAVFREEVLPDGRVARSGPEIVPSSTRGEDSMRFVFVDPAAGAGTFYRYTVWAVTEDGLLSRAFAATLRTPE
jgi:hypothetical protein